MARRLIYLGGNGHCAARLEPARAALANLAATSEAASFDLIDAAYPGFDGRPRAPSFDAFLDDLDAAITAAPDRGDRLVIYATGIGGLLALCLRARGKHLDTPLILQGAVLWGLERRLMPKLLRLGPARYLLNRLFAWRWFQRRFVRKQFERSPSDELQRAFFDGYAACTAAPDFFAWLTPALLRNLERDFKARPEALASIIVWWGGRDHVVTTQELAWTSAALGVDWPMQTFPHWGHYPMIDVPAEWVRAVSDALATPEVVPGRRSPQAG